MTDEGLLEVGGIHLEYRRIGPPPESAPTLVFLHEGLGSTSLWKDFPDRLAERTGCGALVYSRAGYGKSDPIALPRPVRFMHDEAMLLPQVLEAAGVRESILVGHSDGASIALIHAGRDQPAGLRGLVLEAPHVFTEPGGLKSIEKIAKVYQTTDLRERLARHHGENVDVAFWGWNRVWLDLQFRAWNIEEFLPGIQVPTLIVQGDRDEYGTWRQIEAIQRQSGALVESVLVRSCGHSPHRDQPAVTLDSMTKFIRRLLEPKLGENQ